jgi:hypothetical protein
MEIPHGQRLVYRFAALQSKPANPAKGAGSKVDGTRITRIGRMGTDFHSNKGLQLLVNQRRLKTSGCLKIHLETAVVYF